MRDAGGADSAAAAAAVDERVDVIVLNNNQYGGELKRLSREEFLASGSLLADWIRRYGSTGKRRES